MNVSQVCTFRNVPKQHKLKESRQKQDFNEAYDKHLNETLEDILPKFASGDCDAVFITSRRDKNGNWQTAKISLESVNKKGQDTLMPEKKQNIFSKLFNRQKNNK